MGASSGVGLETVQTALDAGHFVRAFARGASGIPIENDRLEKMPGDALSPTDVAAAVAGIDVVVQSLGVPFNARLILGPITLFSQATAILLPAMQKAHVRRLVTVTGFGAGELTFDAVQLIDDTTEGQQTGVTVGADIDAVGAISSTAAVPEPSTFALLGMGAVGLIGYRRWKRQQAA